MRPIAQVFFLIMVVTTACAQQADTLVYAEGKILNKTTKELVAASISYQSLPYGNIVGQMNGSTYRFPFFTQDRYEIIVEAAGFAPAKYMLDPGKANGERKVIQDVELGTHAPAALAAETAHTVGKVMNLDNLIFPQGKATIEPTSFEELDKIVAMLLAYPKMVVQLEGHTDTRGNADRNMELSQERVEAVKSYLVNKDIKSNRIKTKAFGGTQPLSREDTEAGHAMNRRVQLRILQN
jgi:OOP family OmpA-OmpF porin